MDLPDGFDGPQELFDLCIRKGKSGDLLYLWQLHAFSGILLDPTRINAEREERAHELQALAGRQRRILPTFPEPSQLIDAHRTDHERTEFLHQLLLNFPIFPDGLRL